MPVVDLAYQNLVKLVGDPAIRDVLPFLGLDIESDSEGVIRVEYSPNRPDYSTEYGISLGLQGLMGTKTGLYNLDVADSEVYAIRAEDSVSQIRPRVASIAARGAVDDYLIRQLIAMQEDLHTGLGRRRRVASIGIHDLDSISFPVRYAAVSRDHRFVPLDSEETMTVDEILDTPLGEAYGHILDGHADVPMLLDADDRTISFPPVINSALTTVTERTKGLLIEVTGLDRIVEDVLMITAVTLQAAGLVLHQVDVSGAGNCSLKLDNRRLSIPTGTITDILGLSIPHQDIISSLNRCRLDASIRDGVVHCTVPPYRFDILGPMDLVEEVALGYGIGNLSPVLSPSPTIGQKNDHIERLEAVGRSMIGLGYTEVMSSSLASRKVLYDMPRRSSQEMMPLASSKSQEHTMLRDSILPGLVSILSRNIHEVYPQRLFETGTTFLHSTQSFPVDERVCLACVDASHSASFSNTKSILQAILHSVGAKCNTAPADHPTFEKGHGADVICSGRVLGHIGELSRDVIDDLKIRVPVAAFEIDLDGIIS